MVVPKKYLYRNFVFKIKKNSADKILEKILFQKSIWGPILFGRKRIVSKMLQDSYDLLKMVPET